ncbi:MAG TPA: ribosome small subunit-dependent GTPase A [Steroidobacteraceae bacterium]|jgi:ribosome biogenesis GTPase|nr:ribosome small subunit-dependent GTPase A [Steroidobacteraceae bacterium]
MIAPTERARVSVTHGRHLRVRTLQGEEIAARSAQRNLHIVCGDWVRVTYDRQHAELRVLAVEPRSTALYRSNARGGGELIAANVSLLLVVFAPVPQPDLFVVDRYLCAARSAGLDAQILLNKCELADEALREELAVFAAAGYRCLELSSHAGIGIQTLREALVGQTAMLVGQSGTGKSSLLRVLVPGADAAVGSLARDQTGRHTTTATHLYPLPRDAELLDSPGVRDFAPAVEQLPHDTLGFVEVETLGAACRFTDCLHLQEPDCAVRAALGTQLAARRYESYRRLRRLYQRLSRAQT